MCISPCLLLGPVSVYYKDQGQDCYDKDDQTTDASHQAREASDAVAAASIGVDVVESATVAPVASVCVDAGLFTAGHAGSVALVEICSKGYTSVHGYSIHGTLKLT